MEIPFRLEARPDTGVTNGMLGMWLFLASEAMLFGGLFSSYALLRTGADVWPGGIKLLGLTYPIFYTLLLFSVSLLMGLAGRTVQKDKSGLPRLFIAGATLCALLFVAIKLLDYGGKISEGVVPATSTFFAVYFLLTGMHAVHVLGGIAANLSLLTTSDMPGRLLAHRTRLVGMYWHFVDIIWLLIFFSLYLY